MNLTREQLAELLKRPGIQRANPGLGAVVPAKREPNPQPALDRDVPPEQSRSPRLEICVTLIACRRKRLDGDNLQGGFKHLRDEIARTLGLDDGDDGLRWEYGQVEVVGQTGTIVRITINQRR